MNRVFLKIFAVTLMITTGGCSNKKVSNMNDKDLARSIIEMEIAALEESFKGNFSTFLSLYSEKITYFDPSRHIYGFDKIKEYYESFPQNVKVEKYDIIDPVVQIYGETAILTHRIVTHSNGKVIGENCTEVYQRQLNKPWKIIHSHFSLYELDKE